MDTKKRIYPPEMNEWDCKLLDGEVKMYEVPKEFHNRSAYIYAARCLRDGKQDKDTYTEKLLLEHMLFCDIIDAKIAGNKNRYEDLKDIHISYFVGNGIYLDRREKTDTTEQESAAKSTNEILEDTDNHYCFNCSQWKEQPNYCASEIHGICKFLSEGGRSLITIPRSVVYTSGCFGCNYWKSKNKGRGNHYPLFKSQKMKGEKDHDKNNDYW